MKKKIPTVYTYYMYYRFAGMRDGVYDTYLTLNEATTRPTSGLFIPPTLDIIDDQLIAMLTESRCECHTCIVSP